MKYAIDTEYIDTPTCSALISLAIVREDGASLYYEFSYSADELTPWLKRNVIPHLANKEVYDFHRAAREIRSFIGNDRPEFWCYFGAYDWYWFCRLFGGFMSMPEHWPHLFRELAWLLENVPSVSGAEHNALNDAVSIMAAVKRAT